MEETFGGRRARIQTKAVEVTDWAVRVEEQEAVLTWTTASETSNAGFEIQRKRGDGAAFETVEFVDGQGTTASGTDYRYREALSYEVYTYRLVAVSINGNESVVGAPQTVRLSIDPAVRSLAPNPLRNSATFGARVDTSSVFLSALHTLDGAPLRTVAQDTLARGIHRFVWRAGDLPTGLYEQRTRIQTGDSVVARDTAYAAVMRLGAAAIGETGENGAVSTRTRTQFPALYDVPAVAVRDQQGTMLGEMTVAPTVEFVVTTETGVQTFRRTVSEGENTLTLSLSP